MEIILKGKPAQIQEPVFKVLKQVLLEYKALVDDKDDYQKMLMHLQNLLRLFGVKIKAHKLKADELFSFLQAIPKLCGFEESSGKGKPYQASDLSYLYAHLSSCFGWTYDYIDNNMTLSKAAEYKAYLEDNPPQHLLVAAALGYERKAQVTIEDMARDFARSVKNGK